MAEILKTYIAIGVVGLLVLVALLKGIDGAVMASGIAVIAGLGGYSARRIKDKE